MLLVITGIGIGAWILTQSLLTNNDEPDPPVLVTVPTVIGERRADAEAILEDAGLVVAEEVLREEDPEQEPGTVLDQDPRGR